MRSACWGLSSRPTRSPAGSPACTGSERRRKRWRGETERRRDEAATLPTALARVRAQRPPASLPEKTDALRKGLLDAPSVPLARLPERAEALSSLAPGLTGGPSGSEPGARVLLLSMGLDSPHVPLPCSVEGLRVGVCRPPASAVLTRATCPDVYLCVCGEIHAGGPSGHPGLSLLSRPCCALRGGDCASGGAAAVGTQLGGAIWPEETEAPWATVSIPCEAISRVDLLCGCRTKRGGR